MMQNAIDTAGRLADALGEVQHEIERLSKREKKLRATLSSMGLNALIEGQNFTAVVKLHKMRKFDPSLLPYDILKDQQYWSLKDHIEITTQPKPGANQFPVSETVYRLRRDGLGGASYSD